jgi:hypothetical protein
MNQAIGITVIIISVIVLVILSVLMISDKVILEDSKIYAL